MKVVLLVKGSYSYISDWPLENTDEASRDAYVKWFVQEAEFRRNGPYTDAELLELKKKALLDTKAESG